MRPSTPSWPNSSLPPPSPTAPARPLGPDKRPHRPSLVRLERLAQQRLEVLQPRRLSDNASRAFIDFGSKPRNVLHCRSGYLHLHPTSRIRCPVLGALRTHNTRGEDYGF